MAIYDTKPAKYEAVGNGSYLYRWDIQETQVPEIKYNEKENGEFEEETVNVAKWKCEEVTVWSPVSANKITEAVITAKYGLNYEQKLLNDYNAAKMGVYGLVTSGEAKKKIDAYTNYLKEREKLKIKEDENGNPIFEDSIETIDGVKNKKVSEILAYDRSNEVNSFALGNKSMWLDKETRVGLVNSITIEQNAGKTNTVLWFDSVKYTIPIISALAMLSALELYALCCYNVTQKHISAVMGLESIKDVQEYNYKIGYPDKLIFSL